jgi:regulator of RNase E activity RraA
MSGGKIVPKEAPLSADTIKNFLYASTATVSMQMMKRGFRNCAIGGVKPLNPKATRLVGPAYTLRYIPAREDLDKPPTPADPPSAQRAAIEETPPGHVLVIGKFDFPVYCTAAAAPPSMANLHPVEVQTPVGICGVPVYPGDVIVADEDGAIVVPRHLADEVARDSFEQERLEKFVAIRIGQGREIPGVYPPNDQTKADYQAWIKAGEPETWPK